MTVARRRGTPTHQPMHCPNSLAHRRQLSRHDPGTDNTSCLHPECSTYSTRRLAAPPRHRIWSEHLRQRRGGLCQTPEGDELLSHSGLSWRVTPDDRGFSQDNGVWGTPPSGCRSPLWEGSALARRKCSIPTQNSST